MPPSPFIASSPETDLNNSANSASIPSLSESISESEESGSRVILEAGGRGFNFGFDLGLDLGGTVVEDEEVEGAEGRDDVGVILANSESICSIRASNDVKFGFLRMGRGKLEADAVDFGGSDGVGVVSVTPTSGFDFLGAEGGGTKAIDE